MKWIERIATVILMLGAWMLATGHAHAEPALWMVKGPHATVYLFGSVHVLNPDQPWRSPKIDAAVKASGSLWLEIDNIDDPASMMPLIQKLGMDQAHPLSTRLTKEQLAKLDTVAKAAGLPGEAPLEPMRPWLAATTLSAAPMVQAGFDPKSGVENVLKPEFVKAGKPVHGFETAEQQFHYFADLPEKSEVDYLNVGVDNFAEAPEKLRALVAAWYAGDEKGLANLVNGDFRDRYPELYRVLIVHRNEAFAKQIQDLLKGNQTVFVAIGAGHLVGEDGVPAMLEKLGFRVVRQ